MIKNNYFRKLPNKKVLEKDFLNWKLEKVETADKAF